MIRRRGGRLITAAAIGLGVLASSSGASAATSGRIESIDTTGGKIQVVFAAVGLGPTQSIDTSSVVLRLNTQTVPSKAEPVTGTSVQRTAVLAIDTSGSMAGARIAGARAAAQQFLNVLPPDVRVGLVTFADRATVVVPATTNRDLVRAKIAALRASGNTALYDATALALRTAGSSGVRNVVLLTDGTDDGSRLTLPQALAVAHRSDARLDAVGFRQSTSPGAPLSRLAGATGGQVVSATQTGQITQAFNNAAENIAKQIVVTADVPESLSNQTGSVRVTATVGGQPVTDSAFTNFGSAATPTPGPQATGPQPVSVKGTLGAGWLALAIILIFVGLALIFVFAIGATTDESRQSGVRRRLSIYTLTGRVAREREEQQSALGTSTIARSAVELAGRVVQQGDFESGLARRLDAAGIPLRPAEWLLIHIGFALVLGLVLLFATGGSLIAAILGVIIGVVVPLSFLTIREERRRSAFLESLPDTLQLIAGSLSAGYSMPQAIDAVVKEGAPAVANEFNRVLVETRLGMPIEDALDGVAARMRSVDFAWVVMAIRIQRDVGGNLAEVLTTVAETLRDRERIRRQVQVLSAEGRLSAVILAGLPILFAIYLVLVRREYIKILWTTPGGLAMLVLALVLMTVGVLWLRKVVKVEV